MIDTKKLRQLSQAATPGPWGTTDAVDKTIINSSFNQLAICYRNSRALKDAEYIAAANPAAINELLDELDSLRVALREIAWSNDSKWQADRARDVLGEEK